MAKIYLQYEESVSQISLLKVDDYLGSQNYIMTTKMLKSHLCCCLAIWKQAIESGPQYLTFLWLSQGTLASSEDLFGISPAMSGLGLLIDK